MGMFRNYLLAVTVVLALAACSGDGDEPSTGGSSTRAGAPAGTPAGQPSSAPALAVLASRDAVFQEIPIRVELNELRVEGRVTRLAFTARNLAPVEPGRTPVRWQIATFFDDGINQTQRAASPDDTYSADGVYLLDGANAKRYLAARNADRGCVCSSALAGAFVSPGSGVVLTSFFAALPAGVTAVDVDVPGFGSFGAVPVSR
jgi:hypothetical protein